MSVKVIDLNEEATKEEEPEQIEETKQEEDKIETPAEEEKQEETKAEEEVVKPTPKEKAKAKAKTKVQYNTCDKSMTYKNFRYYHDDHCSEDKIEYKPIKKQANPKGKAKPKPKPKPVPVPVFEDEDDDKENIPPAKLSARVKNQILKPQTVNPLTNIQKHYQLLQNEYIKQKQEKYNNLCQNMFKAKPKKR